ncbi:YdaS family helix-turn-helix protein [Acinetobacter sp. TUM15131]|uniref:YdaS family helix-turn-helix protein n=1 Tax=Acinetobacter sp. TUM15131 TaxID=2609141 RepID=UPI00124D7F8D|nr:YdaS family helix-turn-helix protein [Acinetobacter sp. TUM15131]
MNNYETRTDDVTDESIVKAAIQKAGGVSAVARLVTKKSGKAYSYQAVQSWISQDRIPPKYIPIISDVTGISKSTLDPIVFQEQ